jgi:beta-phosphoglucomutase-like phosphatase (HAD superfamily)
MIKLIIFDLDGVLVEARDIHYMALNDALRKMDESYTINEKEHLSSYDGLPTSKKLMKLSKEKGLPLSFHKHVWKEKQKSTELVIPRVVKAEDHRVIAMTLRRLKADGYKIYCASNSIRSSVKLMLLKAGYMEYIDEYLSKMHDSCRS